jgi:2-keto-3-deoxy-L-rhamnonate aldolase RhmA
MTDRLAGTAGAWVSLADPAVAELTAAAGFDFVMLDLEHTPNSLETLTEQARAVDAAAGGAVPMARVPWNDPVRLKRVLDTGVGGVMVPMVETRAEAAAAVEACQYPPDGRRGIAAGRAAGYGAEFAEYVSRANDEVTVILQIEAEAAVENAEEIAAVEGVDALFVGPADLSADVGALGDWEDERVQRAIERTVVAGEAAGVPVGTLASRPEAVGRWHALGFDFLIVGIDAFHLLDGHERSLTAFRDAYE